MILVATIVIVLLAFRVWHVMESQKEQDTKLLVNGNDSEEADGFIHYWYHLIDQFGIPFGHGCVSFVYKIYSWFTLFNVTVFILKYVPTGLYMYKFLRNIYTTSRERIKQKQMELEDIQLQIQIVNNKLCVRDVEFTERAEQLRREADRLRQVRARVRKIIATDEALRRVLDDSTANDNVDVHTTPEEDRKFIVEMLKGLKNVAISERQHENMECGEYAQANHNTPENSVYSSLSDVDIKQDCHVKIVKVTNVYKVAYLKHFIKQKRLRRAQKHALLKKRMECIKNLLEQWQKSLTMVLSNNLTILNMESQIDAASQEAMGDFSKPTLREYADSDSDLRNGCDDATQDEYSHNWVQNTFQNSGFNYEDIQDSGLHREFGEPQEISDAKYPYHMTHPFQFHDSRGDRKLCVLPEETISQMAIEKIKSEEEDFQSNADGVM